MRWDIALRDLDVALDLDSDADGKLTWGEVAAPGRASRCMRCSAWRSTAARCAPTGRGLERRNDGAYAVLLSDARRARCRRRRESPTRCSPTSIRPTAASPRCSGRGRTSPCPCSSHALAAGAAAAASAASGSASGRRRDAQRRTLALGISRRRRAPHPYRLRPCPVPALPAPAVGDAANAGGLAAGRSAVAGRPAGGRHRHRLHSRPFDHARPAATEAGVAVAGFIEPAIAVTIILAALDNVLPIFPVRRIVVTFFFGLIHGFGFANVLAELNLPRAAFALGAVAVQRRPRGRPAADRRRGDDRAFTLRRWRGYARVVIGGGSLRGHRDRTSVADRTNGERLAHAVLTARQLQ